MATAYPGSQLSTRYTIGASQGPSDDEQNGVGGTNSLAQGGAKAAATPKTRDNAYDSEGRQSSDSRAGRRPSVGSGHGSDERSSVRTCNKCREPLTGQFVRALHGTFHLDCFKCADCGQIVASKFFPVDADDGSGQYPLCETDYFGRLDLLCFKCGGALRGSYITALDRKYHIEHFTCSVCPTVFGAEDSYYEHDARVFCHYHYSTQFAQRCTGCQNAILKQFVEIFRNGQNQHWHPECYMIHKFWNHERNLVRQQEKTMEDKVYRIWHILSTFEESSASCISDMLLQVSNGAYYEGVLVARRFIFHVDVLFGAIDSLAGLIVKAGLKELAYGREAKLLCKKVVAFFTLLSKTQDTGVRKLGVTQELLSLVTGLAHYLKLLIRIGLQGALKLERETASTRGLHAFLDELADLEHIKEQETKSLDLGHGNAGLAGQDSDCCAACQQPIDDECVMRVYCADHVKRAPGPLLAFSHVTKLQQYVFLLKVALARLLEVLKAGGTLPHTSDDPNLAAYVTHDGQVQGARRGSDRPSLLPAGGSRSKSYAGPSRDAHDQQEGASSSLEQTVGEMKRLRSTRNERTLSTTVRKPRASRILDGPTGASFHIVEDSTLDRSTSRPELTFGHQDGLTLDDIPRIVAAEQAKEQRPNAYRHAGSNLLGRTTDQPRLVNGHPRVLPLRAKRYFSELSALEYFIVRTCAVLSMQPLLDGHFTAEELLGLIESRKTTTFWGKVSRALRNDGKTKKKGIFGVPLDALVDREGAESTNGVGPGALRVPALLDDAISAMKQMDMSVEGVFRKNGNIKRLKEAADLIDANQAPDLTRENPVQVAALLKKFLRDMPDPLLTFKLHKLWITTQKLDDPERRRRLLHLTCCLMPKSHRDTMEVLFSFLKWAASFAEVDEESGSKMDVHNLATVMAPNILHANQKKDNAKAPVPQVDDSFLAIEAVHMLIQFNDTFSQLHNASADLTTKDIMSRYQDIVKGSVARQTVQPADAPAQGSPSAASSSKSPQPLATRIDADPYQQKAWNKQSSVRPVQNFGPPQTGSNMTGFDFVAPSSPYARNRSSSLDSQPSQNSQPPAQQVPYRQSYQPRTGGMGVAG
ncbi:hypothetical protein DV737_g1097, partial [Chaetothyriales sp. CBS 132003]